MPFLPAAQSRAGRGFGSASAVADSKQTLLCTHLSAALLVGMALNATLGWSWAAHRRPGHRRHRHQGRSCKEGRDAWKGKGCCATPAAGIPAQRKEMNACGCHLGCDGCDCCG